MKIYRRTDRGDWPHEAESYRDGERFELPALTGAISVAEIYDDILDAADRSLLR